MMSMAQTPHPPQRLVIVSNRLPVAVEKLPDGSGYRVTRGAGGLVTALNSVLQGRGGLWIGWAGTPDEMAIPYLEEASREAGYNLRPVLLSREEIALYYDGFSNEVLWPLFHDLTDRCNFDPKYWTSYESVNRKFAEAIARETSGSDYIWIQDYHLCLGAAKLKELGVDRKTGFFLHIPFPPLDIFLKLPWRFQILQALLEFDLLAFQTVRDRRNFVQCVRTLIPGTNLSDGQKVVARLSTPNRELRVAAIPIGIDFDAFGREAAAKDVADGAWYIHERLPDRQLILGADRLDYSKGIPHRLRAVGNALERFPELRENVTFIQLVVPSRQDVPEYQQLRAETERLVGEINGRFTTSGWTPVHYIARSVPRDELLSFYRTAEIALVTPLKDGMNLVAKEFCACSLEENAVLVLSEFAGAAAQFHQSALMVNPYDIEGMANAIHRAYHMDKKERRSRMRRLRRNVQRYSIYWWLDTFLQAAISRDLSHFPRTEYFVPQPTPKQDVDSSDIVSSSS